MKKLLSCAICMLLMMMLTLVSSEIVNANDPPGGNPALTWYSIDGNTTVYDVTCVPTSHCLEEICYRWDTVFDNIEYKSFEQWDLSDFGYCRVGNQMPKNSACIEHKTVRCAYVWVLTGEVCDGEPIIKTIYVKDACYSFGAEPVE